jgi:hypothetical protein
MSVVTPAVRCRRRIPRLQQRRVHHVTYNVPNGVHFITAPSALCEMPGKIRRMVQLRARASRQLQTAPAVHYPSVADGTAKGSRAKLWKDECASVAALRCCCMHIPAYA